MADPKQGTGFIAWIKSLIAWSNRLAAEARKPLSKDIHLEPKYWPEVKDYMESIKAIIKSHTIEDANVQQVNENITNYIFAQINKKGSIEDIEERYLALDTLADRILVNELSKIAGLKQSEGTRAEFSEATQAFKKRLAVRHKEDSLAAKK